MFLKHQLHLRKNNWSLFNYSLKICTGDYRELQGEPIPFKKLGYSSLDKLFLDVPGFKVTQVNGEWYVDAIASQDTQHIAAMVSRQKSSKKVTPKLNYPVSQFGYREMIFFRTRLIINPYLGSRFSCTCVIVSVLINMILNVLGFVHS